LGGASGLLHDATYVAVFGGMCGSVMCLPGFRPLDFAEKLAIVLLMFVS